MPRDPQAPPRFGLEHRLHNTSRVCPAVSPKIGGEGRDLCHSGRTSPRERTVVPVETIFPLSGSDREFVGDTVHLLTLWSLRGFGLIRFWCFDNFGLVWHCVALLFPDTQTLCNISAFCSDVRHKALATAAQSFARRVMQRFPACRGRRKVSREDDANGLSQDSPHDLHLAQAHDHIVDHEHESHHAHRSYALACTCSGLLS